MGYFGSELYHGCLNAPKKKLHPMMSEGLTNTPAPCYTVSQAVLRAAYLTSKGLCT
jgi:hypothetical protein